MGLNDGNTTSGGSAMPVVLRSTPPRRAAQCVWPLSTSWKLLPLRTDVRSSLSMRSGWCVSSNSMANGAHRRCGRRGQSARRGASRDADSRACMCRANAESAPQRCRDGPDSATHTIQEVNTYDTAIRIGKTGVGARTHRAHSAASCTMHSPLSLNVPVAQRTAVFRACASRSRSIR
jgi:hypothetical protein